MFARHWLTRGLAFLFVTFILASAVPAQDDQVDEEVARLQKVTERFVTVLEKNPRRGTALDKVYGFHVENGSLEPFVQSYRDRTSQDPKDGTAWMVLGLLEAQRGRDAAAVEAFTQAAAALPKNHLPAFYLGQSLVLVGQPDKAVEAFESAIARQPPQADALEIFQALGRVHQRAQRMPEALAVWSRLEKLFPNDARVQEQIAATMIEEGQHAQALPRYEALVKLTKDDYRKSVYRIEAAELKVKLNRSAEAVADLEKLLATLNPTSWLHRDVRRKIEEVFLRTDDQDGLAKYYAGWVKRNPEDVDAMARLARVLARQARVPEAQEWLDKALKLAPSRKELRRAFIEQLVDDQRYTEAVQQYELLDKADPNNPDFLREWGKLILRDTSRPKPQRLTEAEKVWRKLLTARPKDPLAATQVADLFRHAEMQEAALELYEQGVALAPDQPQYREYLGEFYHQLKRPKDALATWRKIAEGKNRTAGNLARLAEVYASFGYLKEALPEMAAACKLDPKDFALQVKSADLHVKMEQHTEALAALDRAAKLAQNEEEREAVLAMQLQVYDAEGSLARRTTELAEAVEKGQTDAKQLFLLARHYEASRQLPEAGRTIAAALKLEPQSIPSLAAAARIQERSGELQAAADLNRRLAAVDRRGRSDYLRHVAELEAQLGRIDEALAAGRDLIASAPGNTDNYEFFATLCFRLGKADDGLEALRRAMRLNPGEPQLILTLAGALSEQFRTDEAIELYWQAFDKGQALDDKLGVILKLTDLYLQTNHLDQILDRLERQRRDADDKREATLCLSQAYHAAGDYGMARQELESLLNENTRDTQLLQQLSKLAETEGDLTNAVKYQEQLAQLAPGPESEYRLATLLAASGAAQESAAILVRLATREEDIEKLLRTIDSLLTSEQHETALLILESKLREEPKNWELLYREGVALAKQQPQQAAQRFKTILALPAADTEPGIAEKNRREKAAKAAASQTSASMRNYARQNLGRLDDVHQVRNAIGLREYFGGRRVAIWSPRDYGQARMAAIGWLYRFALNEKQDEAFVADRTKTAEDEKASPRTLWDFIYLKTLTGSLDNNRTDELFPVARKLAAQEDLHGQYLFTYLLMYRQPDYRRGSGQVEVAALAKDDVEVMLKSFEAIRAWARGEGGSDQMVSYIANSVMAELKKAGRVDDEQRLFNELIVEAKDPEQLTYAISAYVNRDEPAATLAAFDKWAKLMLQDQRKSPPAYLAQQVGNNIAHAIGRSGAAEGNADVLALLDHYLDFNTARSAQERLKAANRPRRSTANQSGGYVQVWYGKQGRHLQMSYPAANEYFDMSSLTVLRNAHEVYTQNDLASDLVKHLQQRLAKSADVDKLYEYLALAYVAWWSEDKETAVQHMTAASELAPQDWLLRMEVARFYVETQEFEQALALVDAINPLDQDTLRERETMALNLAVRLGDHERAHSAAERLFGLRLDAETQIQLASQMRRLGMNDQAEAVLARAQRQAGSRLGALVSLMSAHQSQGRPDVATQIAYQVLRRSRTPSSTPGMAASMGGGMTSDESSRRSALQVLASAGKLKEMIAATEEQLERSPQSSQLFDTLAEYYEAAGQSDKSLELQAKIIAQRPDDVDLGFRYAQRLAAAGKHALACDQYLVVIKKQPRLFGNQSYQIVQTFQQAKRQADLIALFSEIDVRQVGQSYYLVDLVRNLMRDKEQRPAAMGLFKKVWEAVPEYRQYLLSSMGNDELWESDELYALARQSLLPGPGALQQRGAWIGLSDSVSMSSGGVTHSTFQGVVAHALKTNRLPAVRDEIAAAVKDHPEWKCGPLMLAVIDLRLNKPQAAEAARALLEQALEEKADQAIPYYPRWILGQMIDENESLRDVAVRLYEGALTDMNASSNEFEYGPGVRLINLYVAMNRRDDARAILAKAEKERSNDGYDPEYAAQRRVSQLAQLAQHYDRLEYSVDALRLYRGALIAAQSPALGRYSGNSDYYARTAQQQLKTLTARLAAADNPTLLQELLAPREEGKPAVDLMLAAQRDDAGLVRIDSPLVDLLMSQQLTPVNSAALAQQIEALIEKYPDDLSLRVVAALGALRDKHAERSAATLAALRELAEKSPLEALPAGHRANSRQRAAAMPQIGLWLVAAACADQPQHRAEADFFATRAVEAARRQSDSQFATGILLQQSKSALAAGDKPAAEQHLSSLLELALTRPQVNKKSPAETPDGQPSPKANLVPPITLSQFRLALQVAQQAAENDLPELAARAVAESLSGGLPVTDDNQGLGAASNRRVIYSPGNEPASDESEIGQAVSVELVKLSQTWRTKKYPPQLIHDALHDIVFPSAQPGVVLLYPQRLDNWSNPRSLGLELVRWSVAMGQGDALAKELAQRGKSPGAELSTAVLRVSLAVEQQQFADAVEPLRSLAKMMEQPRASVLSAASQAAAVAFGSKELTDETIPILEAVAKSPQTANTSNQQSLLQLLGKHYIARGQIDLLRAMYENYLQSRLAYYSRYGDSDSALSVQRSDLATVVARLSEAGDVKLTLEFLGRYIDVPYTSNNSGGSPLWDLDWQLRAMPAKERYELLKAWTFPSEDRRTLRFVAALSGGLPSPSAFVPQSRRDWPAPPRVGVLSNFTLLVQAADEAKQLDDLQAAVDESAAEKLPHSEPLAALVAIARQDASARDKLQSLADATAQRNAQAPAKPGERQWDELRWQNILVLEAALANPPTRKAAQAWASHVLKETRTRAFDRIPHVGRIIALDSLRDLSDDEAQALLTPGLAHWSPATPPGATTTNSAPAWWTAHGDTVTHLTGFDHDSLYFNYPLTGTFEFSFEAHGYDFSQGEVAYGGLLSVPEFWNNRVLVSPVSRHETITRGRTVEARDWWNTYMVRVSPEAIRFYSNGHLVYEETEPSLTSPWLHLVALDHRRVAMRRLKLSGQPVVPREVRLVDGNRFEGWAAAQYYDKLPNRLTQREPAKKLAPNESAPSVDPRPDSWYADQGVLHGRRGEIVNDRNQSRLWYHRPLRSGETLSYEFFYEPGKTHVHPCLDRLAFLLEPAGVRLHWSNAEGLDPLRLENDNAIDEPADRRGPDKLPLVAGDWNSLQIAIEGDVARLTLNGTLVYERPMEPTNDLRFGLFHYRDQTDVQVRNVVLQGDWPEKLGAEILADLLALASPDESLAMTRARHSLTREEELYDDVYQVWRDSQKLTPAERYAKLREWVLPGPSHPTYRVQAEWTPTNPASADDKATAKLKTSRSHVGGDLVSPAWELVRTAADLNKLDELDAAIREGVKDAPEGTRNLLALQAMVAVARGDDAAALAAIKMLHAQLMLLDPATPQVDRYPELVAVHAASARPALRKEILPLAERLVENQHSHHVSVDWERKVRWLRATVRWLADPQLAKLPLRQPSATLKQWSVVSHPTAEQRGRGLPPPTWSHSRGKVGFHTGQGNDSLYFQSPLTGDFEVTCRRTTYGWKEIRMLYAAIGIDIHHEGQALLRVPLARGGTQIPLSAKIEKWGQQVDYRLAVQDGQMKVFVNGKLSHSERLIVGADPWLAIQTASPHFNGSVENLRITGSPVIPKEIDITASPDLSVWRADYYGDSIDSPEAIWTRQKDEIVGSLHENAPGSNRESVLHYHRPLLEDGELEYEFFHEPGKTEVHPALDRAALLIAADGVKVHYLTDGAYDRSGIAPANATPLAGASTKPPLKSGDWNKLTLRLKGDTLTLDLNGEAIGQYPLEPTNQRLFGLFRYSDATGCRVRNIKYRGDWPATLPAPSQQELAIE